jgi:hypothetical protein
VSREQVESRREEQTRCMQLHTAVGVQSVSVAIHAYEWTGRWQVQENLIKISKYLSALSDGNHLFSI